MITLENERLRVELPEPGQTPDDTYRFDRAGFISEVVLDGTHHFCASEPLNLVHPSSGGRGLCCEFKADYSSEVEDGQYYPKWGIGLLRKDGPYCFHRRYKDCTIFPVSYRKEPGKVIFKTEAIPCIGYAMEEEKTVSLDGNCLTLSATVKNVGGKTITTEEYCHNFLSVDGMAISPDYRLTFLSSQKLDSKVIKNEKEYSNPCNITGLDDGLGIARCETSVSYARIPVIADSGEKFMWKLEHKGVGLSVISADHIQFNQMMVWICDHIFAPEVIQKFTVQPREIYSWSRSWIFEAQ